MPIALYAAFVAATAALMALPGPNVALIVANAVAHGRRYGLVTVAGTSSAMLPQLVLTALGMTGTLTALSSVFEWVRWAGVLYLVILGIQSWRAPVVDLTKVPAQPRSLRAIYTRGFFVSLTNPKTLLFYGAFFPQFVAKTAPILPQLALLSMTFLSIAVVIDCGWALAASRLRGVLAVRGKLRNRLAGSVFLIAAGFLATAKRSA